MYVGWFSVDLGLSSLSEGVVGPQIPVHDHAEEAANNCQWHGIELVPHVVSCGREKDGGQVLVGKGIGGQGVVAVEDSRVGH